MSVFDAFVDIFDDLTDFFGSGCAVLVFGAEISAQLAPLGSSLVFDSVEAGGFVDLGITFLFSASTGSEVSILRLEK